MPSPVSRKRLWAGHLLSAAVILFLLFDATIKLMVIPPVVEAFTRLGFPVDLARGIGTLELVCLIAYVIPRTAIPGAILLTGFLGGAVVTHVRIGDPLLTHALFPVYVGAMMWGGLLLRGRLTALIGELIGSPAARLMVRGPLTPTVIHRV
jgi:DoxX-like family